MEIFQSERSPKSTSHWSSSDSFRQSLLQLLPASKQAIDSRDSIDCSTDISMAAAEGKENTPLRQ